jgi:hypothetical protein
MKDTVIQILIIISSCGAIWLLSHTEHWSRWGFIVGLAGQPLWFYDTFRKKQWGIFMVTLWFTFSYGQGIWNFWITGGAQ